MQKESNNSYVCDMTQAVIPIIKIKLNWKRYTEHVGTNILQSIKSYMETESIFSIIFHNQLLFKNKYFLGKVQILIEFVSSCKKFVERLWRNKNGNFFIRSNIY